MAKEKNTDNESEQFAITDSARIDGYEATIDGTEFKVKKGSDLRYFDNLKVSQIKELAIAGIISLTTQQAEKYRDQIHPKSK